MKFTPTLHPAFLLPSPEVLNAMGPEKALALLEERERLIEQEQLDPWQFGYEPPHWQKAAALLEQYKELWIMGGNGAAKTEFASKTVIKTLLGRPKRRVWCFQTTAPNSKEMQQPVVQKYLPNSVKELNGKRGAIANISYSQKNGFTEGTFVLSNRSQCWFRNYEQDDKTIEGGELDLIWFDELVPLNFVKTCRFRLARRQGNMLVTFTARDGYTPTVKSILSGATTIEDRSAELLPIFGEIDGRREVVGYERMPVVQVTETESGPAAIMYFWTEDNPHFPPRNYAGLKSKLKNASREDIMMRAYGFPTKAIGSRFPLFSDRVHVVRHEAIPYEGTNYHLVDPCGGRNWAQLWVRVDEFDRAFVYREWPDQDTYIDGVGYPGKWAEPDGKLADGRRGEAQKSFGFGLERYKEEIERLESGKHERWERRNPRTGAIEPEIIFERQMDSRYGNTPTHGKESPTTLIEQCAEPEIGLNFLATSGRGGAGTEGDNSPSEGIDLINNWLAYDKRRPIDGTNAPRLFISERCKNLIFALGEWTGADGKDGATKDWIDILRYFVLCDPRNVEGEILSVRRGGSY